MKKRALFFMVVAGFAVQGTLHIALAQSAPEKSNNRGIVSGPVKKASIIG